MENLIKQLMEEQMNKGLLKKSENYKIYKTKLPRKLKKKYKKEHKLAITVKYVDSIPNISYTIKIEGDNEPNE